MDFCYDSDLRPEAIEARRQVEESYMKWRESQRRKPSSSEQPATDESSPAIHLQLVARHFLLLFGSGWRRPRTSTNRPHDS
jgi:hypothetical protein